MKLSTATLAILFVLNLVLLAASEDCSKQLESYTGSVCRDTDDDGDCRRCVEDQTKASSCKNDKDCQKAIFCLEEELIQKKCIKT